MKLSGKITWVGIYAIAMAFLETAVVVYLRRIYGITDLMLSVPPLIRRSLQLNWAENWQRLLCYWQSVGLPVNEFNQS